MDGLACCQVLVLLTLFFLIVQYFKRMFLFEIRLFLESLAVIVKCTKEMTGRVSASWTWASGLRLTSVSFI